MYVLYITDQFIYFEVPNKRVTFLFLEIFFYLKSDSKKLTLKAVVVFLKQTLDWNAVSCLNSSLQYKLNKHNLTKFLHSINQCCKSKYWCT